MGREISEAEITRLAREGRIERRNAPFGEHLMRMPVEDFLALSRLFPDLHSTDPIESSEALDRLFNSELSRPYRVARNAGEVKRGRRDPRIIVPATFKDHGG